MAWSTRCLPTYHRVTVSMVRVGKLVHVHRESERESEREREREREREQKVGSLCVGLLAADGRGGWMLIECRWWEYRALHGQC